jgi:polyphenol oxidase
MSNDSQLSQTVVSWPAPAHVQALCSTRVGGVSAPPYDSLNLGDHVGDMTKAVQQNRERLAAQLRARPVFLKQVHGTQVLRLNAQTPDGLEADASVCTERGLACTVMVADCLPVLFTDAQGNFVAAAHAGWRGLAAGVLEQTYERFRPLALVKSAQSAINLVANPVMAWLGPCIGPDAFEVGAEVKAAFEIQNPQAAQHFKPVGAKQPGKYLANLPALARQRLQALGIDQIYGNDGTAPWCTVSNPSRFFSHRRDGVSGRFVACVALV